MSAPTPKAKCACGHTPNQHHPAVGCSAYVYSGGPTGRGCYCGCTHYRDHAQWLAQLEQARKEAVA